jgi:hypothetical protein
MLKTKIKDDYSSDSSSDSDNSESDYEDIGFKIPSDESINIDDVKNIKIEDDIKENEEKPLDEIITIKNVKTPRQRKSKNKEPVIMKDIQLYDYQLSHVNVMFNFLSKSYYAIDLSMLGSGKTYSTSYIYQKMFNDKKIKHIIVISPKSVQTKWLEIERDYGIVIHTNISFRTLTGVKFKQPKHGLLKRRDYIKKVQQDNGMIRDIEKCDYFTTKEYLDLVNEGILLVIDEIQNIKNVNNQSDACRVLIEPICDNFSKNCNSRVLLLSGSPIDKEYQVVTLFKSLNIMKEERLSVMNPQTFQKMWRGMQEIEDYCLKFRTKRELEIIKDTRLRRNVDYNLRPINNNYVNEETYCYKLFQNVVKPELSSSMSCKIDKYNIYKRNSFYNITDEKSNELLKKGIKLLIASCSFNPNNNTVNFGNNGAQALQGIQRALTMIETAKIPLFIRITKEILNNYPKNKVVIAVNYTATLLDLMNGLKEYDPISINGSVSTKNRLINIKKFQENNNKSRLLIANASTICCGIDLNDKHGDYERVCFVSPNYKTIELYQLAHRFQRIDTKSNSILNLVFVKNNIENKIIDSISRKSTIMKETTTQQVEDNIIFPCDFDNYIEPDEFN